ncbi:MAG: SulP family inorganic anion transporter [Gemmatimonadaceae bacterium]|nr:SulP family inorganic anion transporter [Gemmatimonadaceae bacterium]
MKQIPAVFGVVGGLENIAAQFSAGPLLIAAISLIILFGWPRTPMANVSWLSAALVVVVMSAAVAMAFSGIPSLALDARHYVSLPIGSPAELLAVIPRPNLAAFLTPATWVTGVTIAVVASIETLLSLQAIDRLDPLKRRSAPDRELLAQGVANTVSGFLGGLPVTAVIVRGGANITAGGRERMAALVHGLLLLLALLFGGSILNRVPLAALAGVLIHVGLKLCAPALFRAQYKLGWFQFVPYVFTIVAVLATDILKGVIAGIIVGVFFVLRQNSTGAVIESRDPTGRRVLTFTRDGTFIMKPTLVTILDTVKAGERILIDAEGEFVDHDVKEVLAEFAQRAPDRKVTVEIRGVDLTGVEAGGGH